MKPPSKLFHPIIACTAWFALAGQFWLILENRVASVPETIARFFSFYTILTNGLVAVCCTVLWWNPGSRTGRFFSQQKTRASLLVYIVVVGLVYNVILRFIWDPQGFQRLVDELLHTVIPLLFLVYWFSAVPKDQIQWKNAGPWLIYPLAYCIIILVRGSFSGFYPYPFIDAAHLGYPVTFRNIGLLTIVFVLFSFLFIGLARWLSHTRSGETTKS